MDVQNILRTFEFGKLEQPVKLHLKNVYATMGLALISCAIGGYINLFTNLLQIGFLSAFGCLGLVIWLLATKPTKDNRGMRFSMLMGISFLTGINMGPHLEYVIHIDPSIVPTAFLATALVFVCFSLCALLSDDRKFLALGGTLGSGLMWLMLLGLLNIFTGSQLLYQVHVYLGLVIMCGFVLYDTQAIVTKFRNGDDDFICHTLDLFLDFIGIFRRLLIILSDNAKKDKRRRD